MKRSVITIAFVTIFLFLLSCSKDGDKEAENPTMIMVVDEDFKFASHFFVYYDSEKRCKLMNEKGINPADILRQNFLLNWYIYDNQNLSYTYHLPNKEISELYIMSDSGSHKESIYYSFRLDTVIKIVKNTVNIIKLSNDTKEIPVDRQNPYEYPEIIKDIKPGWVGETL